MGPFQDVQCPGFLLVVDPVWMWVTPWSSAVQLLHVRDFSSHWASATHMEKGRVVISFLQTENQE